jgi:general secretion pathway protein K
VTPLPRVRVPLGAGEFSYRITDEAARLNVNGGDQVRMNRLLDALQVDPTQRDIVSDSIQDWRDGNELHRAHGTESDYYLKLPVPYRARNANIQDESELLQIRGVTPELYYGNGGRPGLGSMVTAVALNAVSLNAAPRPVLKAVGLSDAEVEEIVRTRVRTPYATVPARFTGRGLTTGSAIFRIEAEGLIGGVSRSQVVAVVRRGRPGRVLDVTVLSWHPGAGS